MAKITELETAIDTLVANQAKFIADVAAAEGDPVVIAQLVSKVNQANTDILAADQSVTNPPTTVTQPTTTP